MSDEAELIAAARAGDQDAYTALYQAHIGYVRAMGRSILRTEDLDDMCQETFLLAFTRLPSFAGSSGFRTWLTRIAINRCLSVLRRERQGRNGDRRLIQMDFDMAEDDIWFTTRDVELEGVPARLDVQRLLRLLKPMHRRVMEMTYLEELAEAEISEGLGIALATVKRTVTRATQRLRGIVQNR